MDLSTVSIDDIGLSVRSTNALKRAGCCTAASIMGLTEEQLYSMRNLGAKSVEEILAKIRELRSPDFIPATPPVQAPAEPESSDRPEASDMPDTALLAYIHNNDILLDEWGLSVRLGNCLRSAGYRKLSDVFFEDPKKLSAIRSMGAKSMTELEEKKDEYLTLHQNRIAVWRAGIDVSASDPSAEPVVVLPDRETLRHEVMKLFRDTGFHGYSLKDIINRLDCPLSEDKSELKQAIGSLLAEGRLEYVDYYCYRVYPSFYTFLQENVTSDRSLEILLRRTKGYTLDAIGQEFNVTRERVRQIQKKAVQNLRRQLTAKMHCSVFSEDYYQHLYETYNIDRDIVPWLAMPEETWGYLSTFLHAGSRDPEEALSDTELDPGLRLKIQHYLNRKKVQIDDVLIPAHRSDILDYLICTRCRERTTIDALFQMYDETLLRNHITDEKLQLGSDRGWLNRVADKRNTLWNLGQSFRCYDIDAGDYTELLEALDLDGYQDVEISTQKFFEEFPALMQRYDIRDQYELHNLLRKLDAGKNANYKRMPTIAFGHPNMAAQYRELLFANAPISLRDFAELLHKEFGCDPNTVQGDPDFIPLRMYLHNGIFSVDARKMPRDRMQLLHQHLPEPFYYYEEMQAIYRELFPQGDPEEINAYNLKQMGFIPLSRYAVQHFGSLEEYLRSLLLAEDISDITPVRERFVRIMVFYQTLQQLYREYQLIEFAPNQVITLRKLATQGITRETLREFCDAVSDFVRDGSYFTIHSLNGDGFTDPLYDLGFEEWFYASVLAADPRFSECRCLGGRVLYKGRTNISIQSFLAAIVDQFTVIDRDDLRDEVRDTYGCRSVNSSDLLQRLANSRIYYNNIMDRFYTDKELYYKEIGM